MAITDAAAVRYSNSHLRPNADRMARCYYRAKEIEDLWDSIAGNNDAKFALLGDKIERVASLFDRAYKNVSRSLDVWDAHSMGSLFPNDAAEVLHDDGSGTGPDPNRPEINGQDITRVYRRMQEFRNWLEHGTDADKHFVTDANVTLTRSKAYLFDVMRLVGDGSKEPTTNWGRVLVKGIGPDLIQEYDTTNPSYLSHLLAAAVNPRDANEFD